MTLKPREIELIHASVDGEPHDSQALAELLAESDAARALRGELISLAEALRETPELEPPPDLKASILAQLPRRSPHGRRSKGSPFDWLFGVPMRFAFTFVLGLGVGMVMLNVAREVPPVDGGQVVGTMGRPSVPADALVVARADLDAPGVSGELVLSKDGGRFLLRCSAAVDRPLDLVIDVDGEALALTTLEQTAPTARAVTMETDRLTIGLAQAQVFVLALERRTNTETTIEVRAVAGDRTIGITRLTAGASEAD